MTRLFIEAAELEVGKPGTIEALPYTLRVHPGEAGLEINRGGMPVREVIKRAGADPGAIGYLTVVRPNGTTAYLPAADFAEPPPFPQGPALFSADSGSVRFLRPLTADPDDVNAEDNIATAGGEPLAVGLHQGNVLSVQASASSTAVAAGEAVRFSATASGGRSGEAFEFRWSFGDGGGADGASASHAFGGSGTYEVRVTATGSQGSGGESAPLFVVVGNPPSSPQPGAGPSEAVAPPGKAAGPSGKGGPGRGGKGTPKSRGGSESRDGSAVTNPGERKGHKRHRNDASTPSEASPPQEYVAPPAEGAAPGSVFAEPDEAEPNEESAAVATPKQPHESSPPSAGESVEGLLVANYLDPASAAAAAAASSRGSESVPGASDGDEATLPVVALIVVGLLVAGVLWEWRGTRLRTR